ncbi:hypothetical protein [Sphingobacterium suaedae]|uniref:Uncharacterized protein n=1 Tax=Sphingobacterium suaedae TaxID=1686402 RepID=A0ABW5KN24_9SPHI
MRREDLFRVGDPIESGYTLDGKFKRSVYTVAYQGTVVGVGIFHAENDFCTIAFAVDQDGMKTFFGHVSDEYPIERFDMQQLASLYTILFKE